jgi:hypothetical protein
MSVANDPRDASLERKLTLPNTWARDGGMFISPFVIPEAKTK